MYYEPYSETEGIHINNEAWCRRCKGNKRCPFGIISGGEGGHLRRVPWLVRPRREWAEEGI
jgi:hypothetical protein